VLPLSTATIAFLVLVVAAIFAGGDSLQPLCLATVSDEGGGGGGEGEVGERWGSGGGMAEA
jgi:hypothetical protein